MMVMMLNRRLCVRAAGVCAIFSRLLLHAHPSARQGNPDNDRGGKLKTQCFLSSARFVRSYKLKRKKTKQTKRGFAQTIVVVYITIITGTLKSLWPSSFETRQRPRAHNAYRSVSYTRALARVRVCVCFILSVSEKKCENSGQIE